MKVPRIVGVLVAILGSIVAAVIAYWGTTSDLNEFVHGSIPANELAARALVAATTGLAVPLVLAFGELAPGGPKTRWPLWLAGLGLAVVFGVGIGITLETTAALPAAILIPTLVFGTLAFKDAVAPTTES